MSGDMPVYHCDGCKQHVASGRRHRHPARGDAMSDPVYKWRCNLCGHEWIETDAAEDRSKLPCGHYVCEPECCDCFAVRVDADTDALTPPGGGT